MWPWSDSERTSKWMKDEEEAWAVDPVGPGKIGRSGGGPHGGPWMAVKRWHGSRWAPLLRREAQQARGRGPLSVIWIVDEEWLGGRGSFNGIQASGIGWPLVNRQALTTLLMRKDLVLTPGCCLTATAYFRIANICILHSCWPVKEFGLLILLQRNWDLTHGIEIRLAKDYQPLMKEEVWRRMEGCWIGSVVMACGPLGARARWPRARALWPWQACRQIWRSGHLFGLSALHNPC